MNRVRLLAFGLLLSLGAACQSVLSASGGGGPAVPSTGLLPPASRDVEVQVASLETSSVAYLVDQLSDATGVRFTAFEQTREMMKRMPSGLNVDTTIPRGEAWPSIEGVLMHNGFTLGLLTRRAPHLVAVYHPDQLGGRAPLHRVVLRVDESEIEQLLDHPAFLMVTWVDLPNMDVRQLGNSLRALTADPSGSQSVVPVGNSNSVILTGRAREVTALRRMLVEMDRGAGETAEDVVVEVP